MNGGRIGLHRRMNVVMTVIVCLVSFAFLTFEPSFAASAREIDEGADVAWNFSG